MLINLLSIVLSPKSQNLTKKMTKSKDSEVLVVIIEGKIREVLKIVFSIIEFCMYIYYKDVERGGGVEKG